jgi:hypothetical protein
MICLNTEFHMPSSLGSLITLYNTDFFLSAKLGNLSVYCVLTSRMLPKMFHQPPLCVCVENCVCVVRKKYEHL